MTAPQHMIALDTANKRRLERSALRKHISDTANFEQSCIELAKVLVPNPPACVGGMRASEFLQWIVSRRGVAKQPFIRGVLDQAGVSEFVLVRNLTVRQRRALVDALTSVGYGREVAA